MAVNPERAEQRAEKSTVSLFRVGPQKENKHARMGGRARCHRCNRGGRSVASSERAVVSKRSLGWASVIVVDHPRPHPSSTHACGFAGNGDGRYGCVGSSQTITLVTAQARTGQDGGGREGVREDSGSSSAKLSGHVNVVGERISLEMDATACYCTAPASQGKVRQGRTDPYLRIASIHTVPSAVCYFGEQKIGDELLGSRAGLLAGLCSAGSLSGSTGPPRR